MYMNRFWFSHKTNSQIQDFWADFATVWWFRKCHRTKSCQNASLCIAQEIRYRRHEVWLIQLTKTLNFTRLELCTYNLCMLYLNCSPLVAIETCLDDMKKGFLHFWSEILSSKLDSNSWGILQTVFFQNV